MEIIKFNEAYFDRFLALEKHCFGATAWGRDQWQEILADHEHTVLYLAVENGEPVAFLAIYNWGNEKNYVKITDIGTKEACRGKKIAHKLMETMLEEMAELGMQAYAGETRLSNYPMQKVFEDFGFQRAYTMEGYYDNPAEDAFRYHLNMERIG